MEEKTLISELKKGNQLALERTISTYVGYVSRIVKNVIGAYMSAEDIEEVVSDTFVLLWNAAARIHENGNLKSYLATIARNQALKKLRNYNPKVSALDDDIMILDANEFTDGIEELERKRMLEWALSLMDTIDKEIFIRYYFFMEKTNTISRKLEINESTVRSKLSRGRIYLRKVLTERGGQHEIKNI